MMHVWRNTLSLASSWSKIFSSKWLFNFVFYLFSPRNDWSRIALCPEIEGYFNATNDLFQILFSNQMQTTSFEEITEYSKNFQWTCIREWWWNQPWQQIFHPETFFLEWYQTRIQLKTNKASYFPACDTTYCWFSASPPCCPRSAFHLPLFCKTILCRGL